MLKIEAITFIPTLTQLPILVCFEVIDSCKQPGTDNGLYQALPISWHRRSAAEPFS